MERFYSKIIGAGYGEGWRGVSIDGMISDTVLSLSTRSVCGEVSGLAYLWLETPCSGEEKCPLYSGDQYRLPVPPFKTKLS